MTFDEERERPLLLDDALRVEREAAFLPLAAAPREAPAERAVREDFDDDFPALLFEAEPRVEAVRALLPRELFEALPLRDGPPFAAVPRALLLFAELFLDFVALDPFFAVERLLETLAADLRPPLDFRPVVVPRPVVAFAEVRDDEAREPLEDFAADFFTADFDPDFDADLFTADFAPPRELPLFEAPRELALFVAVRFVLDALLREDLLLADFFALLPDRLELDAPFAALFFAPLPLLVARDDEVLLLELLFFDDAARPAPPEELFFALVERLFDVARPRDDDPPLLLESFTVSRDTSLEKRLVLPRTVS